MASDSSMSGNGGADDTLVSVQKLTKHFPVRGGILLRTIAHVHAADEISFDIQRGETFGLVGESGCGKTTVGRTILRIYPPTSGNIYFGGEDVSTLDRKVLARNMQIIFQDPYGSLDPRITVGGIIGEGLEVHKIGAPDERSDRIREIMDIVGISSHYAQRYPHEFSGGQRQRIGIARSLVLRPQFLVCDEPVSALDVSIQSQILNLLRDLQGEFGLTYLFIAHNLAVVRYVCDRVAVMYLGKIVEQSETAELFRNAIHPYTRALMDAIPVPDPTQQRERQIISGELPSPTHPPTGCRFNTRCSVAKDVCFEEEPPLRDYGNGHMVACHVADEMDKRGTALPQLGSQMLDVIADAAPRSTTV